MPPCLSGQESSPRPPHRTHASCVAPHPLTCALALLYLQALADKTKLVHALATEFKVSAYVSRAHSCVVVNEWSD